MWKGGQWQRPHDNWDEQTAAEVATEIASLLDVRTTLTPRLGYWNVVVETSAGSSFIVADRNDWQLLRAALLPEETEQLPSARFTEDD